jgi:hypothetical protein
MDDREPDAEAVTQLIGYLWGYDLIDIRAAMESFGNGWTVVPKAAIANVSDSQVEPTDYTDDGSGHGPGCIDEMYREVGIGASPQSLLRSAPPPAGIDARRERALREDAYSEWFHAAGWSDGVREAFHAGWDARARLAPADLIPGDPSNSTDLSMSRGEADEVRTLDIDSKIQS